MRDPYEILGLDRTADEAAIKAAYRKLAKRHHPDLHPGDKKAADRFSELNNANDLLSDPERRARFDRGELDAEGHELPPRGQFYRDFRGGPGGGFGGGPGAERYAGTQGDSAGFTEDDIAAFFARHFNARGEGANMHVPGADLQYALTLGFLEAANGTSRRVLLPDGRALDVKIPAGIDDGHTMRLKGQGRPGLGGGPPGDALIEVTVAPHPFFHRSGDDVIVDLPVTLKEAVLGASVSVPTIKGHVKLTIPPGSGDGTRLRLRGRGIREGHQYVELKVAVPPGQEPALAEFLRDWTPSHPFNPRAEMEEP
ncbi:MAG: DnaJ C-terminal domain-containing protein [Acetobacteraceae bacterium]|jgi:DnaJ-class molecular chaperone